MGFSWEDAKGEESLCLCRKLPSGESKDADEAGETGQLSIS